MKLSEIYSAMGLKVKLNYQDSSVCFKEGVLINIESSQNRQEYIVSQYGEGAPDNKSVLCSVGRETSYYLDDLFDGQKHGAYKCMFLISGVYADGIEVQTYTFQTITEYKTSIVITVSDELLAKTTLEKLNKEYIWSQLGMPALFCLNYRNKKKQNDTIRFIGGKKYLTADYITKGIFAKNEIYLKDKYDIPVDIFIAPEIKFVAQSDQLFINDELSEDLKKISNPTSYFERWEAYDALSKKLLDAESEEFGEIIYDSYSTRMESNGIVYEFILEDELDESYKGRELGASEFESKTDDNDVSKKKRRQFAVGKVVKINGNKVTTFFETADSVEDIPAKGVLKLYIAGDLYIMKRRLRARERMIKHMSPIKSIVALIETGASGYDVWHNHPPVTEQLKRNFPRASSLEPEQEEAIKIAINTPDIALIQGPPGTGKTTVIKAICERFREIFEAEEKKQQKIDPNYILHGPKILISSFQNEAVDNAISEPLPGDIPAFRKTAKRSTDSSKEQYQRSLELWYKGLCNSVNGMIEDEVAPEYLEKKRKLDDEFLSYKNAGEPIEKAAELINHYLEYVEIPYPEHLVAEAKAVILAAQADSVDDDVDNILINRIESQRTSKDAFIDDGVRNTRRLIAYISINDDLDISKEIISALEKVCEDDYSDKDFEKYVDAVESLKSKFCTKRIKIDINDKEKIRECILSLANAFTNHYMMSLSSIEGKKSLILSDFLIRMEQDYEKIVEKYSMTTAATCQTSLDLHDDINKTFDLVIIDEAARANPLDLFIPMSMGRKVILVGDHKQLPHMLEPDVLKMLADDPRFKDIPEIEKSLFERLFGMFSKGLNPKAIPLTRQFRMHPDICEFVSDAFYDGLLKTSKKITADDRKSPEEINGGKALTFVNVPITRGTESPGVSKSRQAEVDAICKDVRKIINVDPDATIGLITFYSAQSQLLKHQLDGILNEEEKQNIEVGTVDAFQGKEFDYVLLSCVRSNQKKVVGFLEKPNRLCVAFSRSKKQLAVYGDTELLIQIPCFLKLFDICSKEGGGCYRED